jgi:hypothetical protein
MTLAKKIEGLEKAEPTSGYHFSTYRITLQRKTDSQWHDFPKPDGTQWNVDDMYLYVRDNSDAPLDFGEGVMHDYNVHADRIEQEEMEAIREAYRKRCGTGHKIPPADFHKLFAS